MRRYAPGGVLLFAIHGLDKVRVIVQQLPGESLTDKPATVCILEQYAECVPSVLQLSKESRNMVIETFKLHQEFNLAQYVQAENVPANIEALQRFITGRSQSLLKCYLLCLFGRMAGLVESLVDCTFTDHSS